MVRASYALRSPCAGSPRLVATRARVVSTRVFHQPEIKIRSNLTTHAILPYNSPLPKSSLIIVNDVTLRSNLVSLTFKFFSNKINY
jgi:hypothetical protein